MPETIFHFLVPLQRLNKRVLFFIAWLVLGSLQAQSTASSGSDTSYWHLGFGGTAMLNAVSHRHWAAGGVNLLAVNLQTQLYARYERAKWRWENRLLVGYGLQFLRQGRTNKTSDLFDLRSRLGYDLSAKRPGLLYASFIFQAKTQFDRGYGGNSGEGDYISNFLSPAYLTTSLALAYRPGKIFSLSYAVIALKTTFVEDRRLAAAGAFGVKPTPEGRAWRFEPGTLLQAQLDVELFKHVFVSSTLILFTNYHENFANIDTDWENRFLFKINNWLSATAEVHLRYDDDIRAAGKLGPRLQIRQSYGLGLAVSLGTLPGSD